MLVGRFEATAGRALSDGDTVVTVTEQRDVWPLSAFLQGRGASSGVHRVEFEWLGEPHPDFAVGLVEKPIDHSCCTQSSNSWVIGGYRMTSGVRTCGFESVNPLTAPPKVGDVYALLLNMDAGVCDVAVNGVVKCRPWTELRGCTLWPAVFMHAVGSRMKIRSCVSPDPAGAGSGPAPFAAHPPRAPVAAPAPAPVAAYAGAVGGAGTRAGLVVRARAGGRWMLCLALLRARDSLMSICVATPSQGSHAVYRSRWTRFAQRWRH